jgi:hypothetical protein
VSDIVINQIIFIIHKKIKHNIQKNNYKIKLKVIKRLKTRNFRTQNKFKQVHFIIYMMRLE